jgi:hypothetical protein
VIGRHVIPVAAFLVALPVSAAGQALAGRVFDGYSGEPVARAEVAVLDVDGDAVGLAVSDSLGRFRINLRRAGSYRVSATATGYDRLVVDSVAVEVDQVVTVELRLGPRPLAVEGLTVVARRMVGPPALRAFYDRLERHRKTGRGVILDRAILDQHVGQTGARALARQSLNVREYFAYGGGRVEVKRLGAHFGQTPWCEPAMFLDGLPVDAATIRSIPASSLAGVELYRGAHEVPAEFMWVDQSLTCGVVAAWTRRDGGGRPLFGDEQRPVRLGGFMAGVTSDRPDGSLDMAAVGLELEWGLARSMAGWIQAGLTRPRYGTICAPGFEGGCGMGEAPWMAVVGASLFPTGTELPIAPYVGAGLGLASPGDGFEAIHVLRVGLELVPGPVHVRIELRGDPNGWGVGGALMF